LFIYQNKPWPKRTVERTQAGAGKRRKEGTNECTNKQAKKQANVQTGERKNKRTPALGFA
jgi:hypothetical protein